ncbi:MAG: response regulator [Nanoarchaeota archaeon]|nr:response regulator [Nanoarchaeota archaeon]
MAKKIIWADDNQTFRESMIASLEEYCSRVKIEVEFDEAADGKELVKKVLSSHYDLVFTDNQMTDVHGLQAIAQIREQNKTIPVYMVSSSEVGKRALEVGATGYLEKQDYDTFKSGIENVVTTHLK